MNGDLCLQLTSCDEDTSLTEARDAPLLCLPLPECLSPHHHLGPLVPSSATLQASPPVGCHGPRWDHSCGHSVFLPFLRPCLGFSLSTRCYRICRGKAAPTQLTQEPGPCQPLLELCSGPLPGVCWTSFSTFTSATDRKPLLSIYCVQGRVSPGFLCLGIPQEISPNKVGTAGLAR